MTVETVAREASKSPTYTVKPGQPHPLGATPDAHGTNFVLFTQDATAVQLLLFERHDSPQPFKVIDLDPDIHRNFYFWHCYVTDVKAGAAYGYRVDGPSDVHGQGHRFNPNKVLVDPYGRGSTKAVWDRAKACGPADNVETSMRSVVVDLHAYDWEGDRPINRPLAETIIYEMHVRGLTMSPTSGAVNPGTFHAVIEKIPYLQSLGITAVELLPVFEFDAAEIGGTSPDGHPLSNYWGYSPVAFFTPHCEYCLNPEGGEGVHEFRDMVKAFHRAGIEVILDVVFNHTGEGNHEGPTISFRGLDNDIYYHLEPYDKQFYTNISGCGNTFNCNQPVVDKFISECLLYWVRHMHVDGFRFDLASVLSRGMDGAPMSDPPVLWHIELADDLADTKIIAEAWDAGGLYQVGYFPGYRWAEWNGRFRDDIRRFVKGDKGLISAVASRVAGSADIYQPDGELPINSINFITAHDGFTLNDLVSYNWKHNEANGEGGRDGTDDNASWNCGAEGPTDDADVEALRARQIRNFLSILMLSQGVPMMVMGDEARQTQYGNNNAYCQDNDMTWFDWNHTDRHADLVRYVSLLTRFRRRHPNLHRAVWFHGRRNERGLRDIEWHGCELYSPGWNDPESRVLAYTLGGFETHEHVVHAHHDEREANDVDIHIMLNMEWDSLDFELPEVPGRHWYRVIDTSLASPDDIANPGHEVRVEGATYHVHDRSVAVLVSK